MRLWRIDPNADYGPFNDLSRHCVNLARTAEIGRIEKTVHVLRYLDDESMRRDSSDAPRGTPSWTRTLRA